MSIYTKDQLLALPREKQKEWVESQDWFDESKKIMPDFRHRALRHHAEGCFACEEKFGTTITNSDGWHTYLLLIMKNYQN